MGLTKKEAVRRRMVKVIPRQLLDELSGMTSPWHCDRRTVEAMVLADWTDETRDEILAWLTRHA